MSASDINAVKMEIYATEQEPKLVDLAKAAVAATGFDKISVDDGQKYQEDRASVLKDLTENMRDPNIDFDEKAEGLLSRVYASFTRKEITSLFDKDGELDKTLPANGLDRETIAKGLAQLGRVKSCAIAIAPRQNSIKLNKLNTPAMSRNIGIGF